jgi:polyribonucleotide nucleotidyltransferase
MPDYVETTINGKPLLIETGTLAQQAGGSVSIRYGDTVVLVTATASLEPRPLDFFPLTIEFEERMYAAGKIPGSFFRREGRPGTEAILAARLTDRPIRPLFPKGYRNDVQVIITVLSADQEHDPDVLGTIGASAALMISPIPFDGPLSSVRVARVDGQLIALPTFDELAKSDLDLVVAGTADAIMMVECGAHELSEADMIAAIKFGQEINQQIIAVQKELIARAGKPKSSFDGKKVAPEIDTAVRAYLAEGDKMAPVIQQASKGERSNAERDAEQDAVAHFAEQYSADDVKDVFQSVLKQAVRSNILKDGQRPDGRTTTEVRPLSSAVGILPRTHGTGLFQRGETQVLSITTLGGIGEQQKIDSLNPTTSKRYMHHYNFPPYSVGEVRRVGSPGRREIGHGALAERALEPMIPSAEEFPYTIRVVSEVLGSNGSSSMGSVCGSTLSLMDAGVPIKKPVAGVAMGLILDNGEYAVLTDIAGIEDHLGDMDFKVAGTADGITALQMDIKVKGITPEIMEQALSQAKEGRLFILGTMLQTLAEPRKEMSPFAPRIYTVHIPSDKIGALIGPGGKTIRGIQDATKASIDIQEDGTVFVGSPNEDSARRAIQMIEGLTKEIEPGQVFTGKVSRIMPFGAFVEILPNKDGLVHISELSDHRIERVEDVVKIGDPLEVVVTEIDHMGRINLSHRALMDGQGGGPNGMPDGENPDADAAFSGARGGSLMGGRGPRPGGAGGPGRGGPPRGGFGGGRPGGNGGPGGPPRGPRPPR